MDQSDAWYLLFGRRQGGGAATDQPLFCGGCRPSEKNKIPFPDLRYGPRISVEGERKGGGQLSQAAGSPFERKLLEPGEIVESFRELLQQLFRIRPELQVVFTVSPVRHWKDGATGNQLSKSVLHVAIHRLLEEDERLHYFPAYEIVMDDLRDYRFYAADMLHLSDTAVEYIRQRFRETVVDPQAYPVMEEVEKIHLAMAHRPFRPESEEHRKFKASQLKKILSLEKKYPSLDLSAEREFFSE